LPGGDRGNTPPAADKSSETPSTGDSSKSVDKPGGRPPATGQWWAVTGPKQSTAVAGTTPGTPSNSSRLTEPGGAKRAENVPAAGGSKPPQATFSPVPTLPPGTAGQPGAGSIARATPPSQRLAIVQGFVRTDKGAPVPDARITVGGKQVGTNARGQFVVNDVPLGRHVLVVTAPDFQPGRMALEVSSGEVEKVTVTLRHARSSSPTQGP
jgi:hypothetical protein